MRKHVALILRVFAIRTCPARVAAADDLTVLPDGTIPYIASDLDGAEGGDGK